MSNKALFFCSNPVNGGTAKVFCDLSIALQKDLYDLLPCINRNNCVKLYKKIPNLKRLDVYSEEEICGELSYKKHFVFRMVRRVHRNLRYAKYRRTNISNMRDSLRKNNIKTVVIHNGGYVGDGLCNQMLEASYIENIPVRVMVLHNDFSKSFLQKMRYLKYDMDLCKYATKIITVSQYTKQRIKNSSFIWKDIEVIYNGMANEDSLSLEEKKNNIGYDNTFYNIGMIGNFLKNKGHLHLLQAINKIKNEVHKPIKITIIGNIYEPEYYKECLDYINENGLAEKVNICQGIYNAGEYTELFHFMVVPSLMDESFGLVSLEAMRAGVPVIAYACGGIPEVLQNGGGILVDVGNISALADAIKNMIKNKRLCEEKGKEAKKAFERYFTLDVMIKNYKKILEE